MQQSKHIGCKIINADTLSELEENINTFLSNQSESCGYTYKVHDHIQLYQLMVDDMLKYVFVQMLVEVPN